uniref:Uncharacterized protein n=1 Tax=Nelumbo nucifera TaxID=4432 RepID=A0A822YG06_NELNU|nr:TPA_asm: hypothetical protein HUJ06_029916 [Nelumbo nucifera]
MIRPQNELQFENTGLKLARLLHSSLHVGVWSMLEILLHMKLTHYDLHLAMPICMNTIYAKAKSHLLASMQREDRHSHKVDIYVEEAVRYIPNQR